MERGHRLNVSQAVLDALSRALRSRRALPDATETGPVPAALQWAFVQFATTVERLLRAVCTNKLAAAPIPYPDLVRGRCRPYVIGGQVMDVIEPHELEAVRSLRWLVSRDGSFEGLPLRDDHGQFAALLYSRRWTTRHLDVVTVEGPHQAQAYRASGIELDRPEDLRPVSLLWAVHGAVPEVVEAMASLPSPLGARVLQPRSAGVCA